MKTAMLSALLAAAGFASFTLAQTTPALHPALEAEGACANVHAWVYFKDKGLSSVEIPAALEALGHTYSPAAIRRRSLRRTAPGLFDERDLPVCTSYMTQATGTGATARVASRWLNALSVSATPAQLHEIASLPCVDRVEPVRSIGRIDPGEAPQTLPPTYSGRDFYGRSSAQLTQINVPSLHGAGYTGAGVIIGILDTGFRRDHDAFNQAGHAVHVIAEHDFINHDSNTGIDPGDDPGQHTHGTLILGCIGSYLPNELVGGAYDASFVLCKTEDITSETPIEEDNYVGGLELIEANGGDVATSSLTYSDWYTQADMNGVTAVTSIAVNTATQNGLHCCTAGGNAGHDADPATSRLGAPADALRVLTCGAVDISGVIANFSSDGPSADGRVKPEILACGVGTRTVDPNSTSAFASASGTSLSTPLLAAGVACLVQMHPDWTTDQMRQALFSTASDALANSGGYDPLFIRGYGLFNAALAGSTTFCNPDYNQDGSADLGDVLDLASDVASGTASFPPSDPDFNRDGGADNSDVIDLANVIAGAACP